MKYFMSVVNHINFIAVVVAGIVYWLLGAVWFSFLFGKTWGSELEKHGVKIKDTGMAAKFVGTLIMEIIVAFGCGFIVTAVGFKTIPQAIELGLGVGIIFAVMPMLIAYQWESRPVKLVLIDVLYPVLGFTASFIVLCLWK